jgi:hypothetical protein
MVQHEIPPTSVDPALVVLGIVATLHIGVVVFGESYRLLPPVLAAYVAAWLIVRRATP